MATQIQNVEDQNTFPGTPGATDYIPIAEDQGGNIWAWKKLPGDVLSLPAIGSIRPRVIAPGAGESWVDYDTADQTLSLTNYTQATGLRAVPAVVEISTNKYSSWEVSVSGSVATVATTPQGKAICAVLERHLVCGGTAAINIDGSDYAVVSVSGYAITVTGSPSTGTQTMYWYTYRTANATEIKLHAGSSIFESSQISYVPAVTGWTKGTMAFDLGKYHRSGGSCIIDHIIQKQTSSGSVSGTYMWALPAGLPFDSASFPSAVIANNQFSIGGFGTASQNGSSNTLINAMYYPGEETTFRGYTNGYGPMNSSNYSISSAGVEVVFGALVYSPLAWRYDALCPNVRTVPLGYGVGVGRDIYLGAYTA